MSGHFWVIFMVRTPIDSQYASDLISEMQSCIFQYQYSIFLFIDQIKFNILSIKLMEQVTLPRKGSDANLQISLHPNTLRQFNTFRDITKQSKMLREHAMTYGEDQHLAPILKFINKIKSQKQIPSIDFLLLPFPPDEHELQESINLLQRKHQGVLILVQLKDRTFRVNVQIGKPIKFVDVLNDYLLPWQQVWSFIDQSYKEQMNFYTYKSVCDTKFTKATTQIIICVCRHDLNSLQQGQHWRMIDKEFSGSKSQVTTLKFGFLIPDYLFKLCQWYEELYRQFKRYQPSQQSKKKRQPEKINSHISTNIDQFFGEPKGSEDVEPDFFLEQNQFKRQRSQTELIKYDSRMLELLCILASCYDSKIHLDILRHVNIQGLTACFRSLIAIIKQDKQIINAAKPHQTWLQIIAEKLHSRNLHYQCQDLSIQDKISLNFLVTQKASFLVLLLGLQITILQPDNCQIHITKNGEITVDYHSAFGKIRDIRKNIILEQIRSWIKHDDIKAQKNWVTILEYTTPGIKCQLRKYSIKGKQSISIYQASNAIEQIRTDPKNYNLSNLLFLKKALQEPQQPQLECCLILRIALFYDQRHLLQACRGAMKNKSTQSLLGLSVTNIRAILIKQCIHFIHPYHPTSYKNNEQQWRSMLNSIHGNYYQFQNKRSAEEACYNIFSPSNCISIISCQQDAATFIHHNSQQIFTNSVQGLQNIFRYDKNVSLRIIENSLKSQGFLSQFSKLLSSKKSAKTQNKYTTQGFLQLKKYFTLFNAGEYMWQQSNEKEEQYICIFITIIRYILKNFAGQIFQIDFHNDRFMLNYYSLDAISQVFQKETAVISIEKYYRIWSRNKKRILNIVEMLKRQMQKQANSKLALSEKIQRKANSEFALSILILKKIMVNQVKALYDETGFFQPKPKPKNQQSPEEEQELSKGYISMKILSIFFGPKYFSIYVEIMDDSSNREQLIKKALLEIERNSKISELGRHYLALDRKDHYIKINVKDNQEMTAQYPQDLWWRPLKFQDKQAEIFINLILQQSNQSAKLAFKQEIDKIFRMNYDEDLYESKFPQQKYMYQCYSTIQIKYKDQSSMVSPTTFKK